MTDDRAILTTEQALSMLPEGERIHTFRTNPLALLGADWDREDLIAAIREGQCEIGGEACQNFNHGLVVWTGDNPLFVECKKGFDYKAFEAERAADSA